MKKTYFKYTFTIEIISQNKTSISCHKSKCLPFFMVFETIILTFSLPETSVIIRFYHILIPFQKD